MTYDDRSLVLPAVAAAILAFGLGIAVVTFGAVVAEDPQDFRARSSAVLALVLATPALTLYARRVFRRPLGPWWASFWIAGALAYLAHFWWAFGLTFGSDVAAVYARQGSLVATSNFIVTALWTVDALLALIGLNGRSVAALRLLTHALVLASFATAAVIFREGAIRFVGVISLVCVAGGLLTRLERPQESAHSKSLLT